jgi:hypothetical protein
MSTIETIVTLGVLAVIVLIIVAIARFFAMRRKQITDVLILQSQLADAVAREAPLQGLSINPRARAAGWRKSQVTVEVTGEVPTPDLREKAMRIVEAEASRLRLGVNTVDRLVIGPPRQRPSDSLASRG